MSSPVLATLVFVCSEVMFFAALISAFLITKASSGILFVPPAQVTLPVAATAANTLILMISGYLLHLATVRFVDRQQQALHLFGLAIICGAIFVGCQGYEWVKLISYGMSMTSGIFAACFFLLIGAHAVHAAVTVLIMVYFRFLRGQRLHIDNLKALRLFWLFVVGIWPVLYGLVYF